MKKRKMDKVISEKFSPPDRLSRYEFIFVILVIVLLLTWALYGIVDNEFIVPGKSSSTVCSGISAWLIFGALLCAALKFIAFVVGHFDQKNDRDRYELFGTIMSWVVALFYIGGLFFGKYEGHRRIDPIAEYERLYGNEEKRDMSSLNSYLRDGRR